jgi:hypothetical protein
MTRQCGQESASVNDGTFGNIPDSLAFTAGERVAGAELELDAGSLAAAGCEEQQEGSAGRGAR